MALILCVVWPNGNAHRPPPRTSAGGEAGVRWTRRVRTRAIEATVAYSDRDALHSDEPRGRPHVLLNLQTQRDGLANPIKELIE